MRGDGQSPLTFWSTAFIVQAGERREDVVAFNEWLGRDLELLRCVWL